MSGDVEIHIDPDPSDAERAAILESVRQLLAHESSLAGPSAWRLSGWIAQRTGITDLARWIPQHRRWPASTRLPWGGREWPGLNGRGDAK